MRNFALISTLVLACIILGFQNCGGFAPSQGAGTTSDSVPVTAFGGTLARVQGAQSVSVAGGVASGDLYNVYSPAVYGGHAWIGGWATASEIGPDLIYQLDVAGEGQWTNLRPLAWDNPGYRPGIKPGYHVNDPSVIKHPTQPWLLMYYTGLADQYATQEQMTRRNWIGFATSSDDGKTWHDHSIIIGQDNGSANPALRYTGAWSPSAVSVSENEIRIYYHTGSFNCPNPECSGGPDNVAAQVLMTRVDSTGWRMTGTIEAKLASGGPLHAVNVDVVTDGSRWWMTGNDLSLRNIVLFRSDDGLTWQPYNGGDGILVPGGSRMLLTPMIEIKGSDLVLTYQSSVAGQPGSVFQRMSIPATDGQVVRPSPAPGPSDAQVNESKRLAGQAFVDAFASLQNAKASGATGAALKPFIDVCVAAQNNARNWGVAVDAWKCE